MRNGGSSPHSYQEDAGANRAHHLIIADFLTGCSTSCASAAPGVNQALNNDSVEIPATI